MARGADALQVYESSFRNGSMEIDLTTTDDESADNGDGDDSGILIEHIKNETNENMPAPNTNRKKKKKNQNTKYASRAYKPQKGSAVLEYLDEVLEDVRKDDDPFGIGNGVAWIPPPLNPISKSLGPVAKPNNFYVGNTWVFVWHPMKQFAKWMPKRFTCIGCQSCDHTTVNKWGFRPFHWWDLTVYVLHQWIQCTSCRAVFPTIGPKSLATIPPELAEQFPFMLPNLRGPGMYCHIRNVWGTVSNTRCNGCNDLYCGGSLM